MRNRLELVKWALLLKTSNPWFPALELFTDKGSFTQKSIFNSRNERLKYISERSTLRIIAETITCFAYYLDGNDDMPFAWRILNTILHTTWYVLNLRHPGRWSGCCGQLVWTRTLPNLSLFFYRQKAHEDIFKWSTCWLYKSFHLQNPRFSERQESSKQHLN